MIKKFFAARINQVPGSNTMNKSNTIDKIFLAFLLVAIFASMASAGNVAASGPLESVYGVISDWTTGSVGKFITLSMILVGIVAGVVRQSLMAFAVGIGGGLGLYNAPTIVDTVFGASMSTVQKAAALSTLIQ